MRKTNTLFLTLKVFSATGGIEKVCRVAGKALYELYGEAGDRQLQIFSLHDESSDINNKYFPAAIFTGFGKRRFSFLWNVFKEARNSRLVILSHVNLLIVGFIIKLISPKTKLVLIAHGIEVWHSFPAWKKMMLRQCDQVLPVSDFTKNKMMELYQLPLAKMTTLNNCLDPFLPQPVLQGANGILRSRYGIGANDKVLLTLTRMASEERYKGYEMVMQSIHDLKEKYPGIKYLLVGKSDAHEKKRLDDIIHDLGLQQNIILTGFIPDEEIAAHFALADLYIMPSQKEGFGIVFIEAMFYGKAVIAGNKDGSVDALKNGTFGLLVNPDNQQQITDAITEVINHKEKYIPCHEAVMEHFSFPVYKEKLRKIVS